MAAAILMIGLSMLGAQSPWRTVRSADGITVHTRDVADSDMDEFKAVTVLPARIEVISEVFRDGSSYSKWMADCIEARIVKGRKLKNFSMKGKKEEGDNGSRIGRRLRRVPG